MKKYGDVDVQIHIFLTSELVGYNTFLYEVEINIFLLTYIL
jgi:hypothetical protein